MVHEEIKDWYWLSSNNNTKMRSS